MLQMDLHYMQLFRLSLHSLAAGPGSSSSHLVACITTLYLFCKIRPSLLLRHATTLHPYLSSTCTVWSKHIVFLSKIQLVFFVEFGGAMLDCIGHIKGPSCLFWVWNLETDELYSVSKSTFHLWNILLCGYNCKPGFWISRLMNIFTSMLSPPRPYQNILPSHTKPWNELETDEHLTSGTYGVVCSTTFMLSPPSDPEWHDGTALCGPDTEACVTSNGASQWDLPGRTRGGPHQTHHEAWTNGELGGGGCSQRIWAYVYTC